MSAPGMRYVRLLTAACSLLALTACISAPPPRYQPGIDNTQTLLRAGRDTVSVGHFDAAPGVENTKLSVRGSTLTGGSDGTFAAYLREALILELKTAGRYSEHADASVSGTLTDNRLDAAIKTGSADVAARFVVARNGTTVYDKTLSAHQTWDSSFMGAVAIPAAMRNYATAVQKLLGDLFSDPDFAKAVKGSSAPPK